MSKRSNEIAQLSTLPVELQLEILQQLCIHCQQQECAPNQYLASIEKLDWHARHESRIALCSLYRASRSISAIATPILYHTLHNVAPGLNSGLTPLLRTVIERPDLASHVRHVAIDCNTAFSDIRVSSEAGNLQLPAGLLPAATTVVAPYSPTVDLLRNSGLHEELWDPFREEYPFASWDVDNFNRGEEQHGFRFDHLLKGFLRLMPKIATLRVQGANFSPGRSLSLRRSRPIVRNTFVHLTSATLANCYISLDDAACLFEACDRLLVFKIATPSQTPEGPWSIQRKHVSRPLPCPTVFISASQARIHSPGGVLVLDNTPDLVGLRPDPNLQEHFFFSITDFTSLECLRISDRWLTQWDTGELFIDRLPQSLGKLHLTEAGTSKLTTMDTFWELSLRMVLPKDNIKLMEEVVETSSKSGMTEAALAATFAESNVSMRFGRDDGIFKEWV